MCVDKIRREYYQLIIQRNLVCNAESSGEIILDYDSDKANKRIEELGHKLYNLTKGKEGYKKII